MAAVRFFCTVFIGLLFAIHVHGQQYPGDVLAGLKWRDVGPMRGGRTYAVSGQPRNPTRSTWDPSVEECGRPRTPAVPGSPSPTIRKQEFPSAPSAPSPSPRLTPTSSTSAPASRTSAASTPMASASSNRPMPAKPGAQIGLAETRQIGKIVVDPADPDRVYVAALGHVYKANPERGVFRTTDGGAHWKKVLHRKDPDNVGAVDLALDPQHPKTIYASLWATRRPPWAVYAPSNMPGGGLYKSTDGGDTWTQLTNGLPTDGFVGKIGVAVAPSNPNRLYAVVDDLGTAIAPSSALAPKRDRTTQALRWDLSVRRCRSDMATGEQRASPLGPRMVLRADRGRSREPRPRL